MNWKADRQAFLNVGRVLSSAKGRRVLADFDSLGWPLVPAVASDALDDIVRQFDNGRGVIVFTRSQDEVELLRLDPEGELPDRPMPRNVTVGDVVAKARAAAHPASRPANMRHLSLV